MAFLLFGVLFILLVLGVPIGISMGMSVLTALLFGGVKIPAMVIAQRMFTALDSFPFMAVPFFILAGDLMQQGGVSEKLIRFIRQVFFWIPAHLGVITVISSGFFGAISGSNPATVAAIGGIMIPEMEKAGYPAAKASAIAAASSTLGVIIPPSISMITYALVASVSVGTMFVGGIVPGILLMIAMSIVVVISYRKYEATPYYKITWKSVLLAFVEAIWAIIMPLIILGGIYGGIFTPTEAAAIACVYAFIVSKFIYKKLEYKDLPAIFSKSATSTALVLFIVAVSSSFSWLMTSSGVPAQITSFLLGSFSSKYLIFLMINASLLFLGCFLETQSIILLMTPILLPICVHLGMDPVALGLIMVINTSIGMITPPMAVNLYVASSISGVSIESISRSIVPLFLVLVLMIFIFTYCPGILTFLPNLLQ
ncbi:TRAP transporter large permease [Acetomicrobium sp.]|uniref:TRAP transporter large permease n=1 Tax=Acetomicrobium sp. TaxID=1872099 RepID=UPI001BD168F5|nr:TRAP transporter large permease [Acetomicrobium sp.]